MCSGTASLPMSCSSDAVFTPWISVSDMPIARATPAAYTCIWRMWRWPISSFASIASASASIVARCRSDTCCTWRRSSSMRRRKNLYVRYARYSDKLASATIQYPPRARSDRGANAAARAVKAASRLPMYRRAASERFDIVPVDEPPAGRRNADLWGISMILLVGLEWPTFSKRPGFRLEGVLDDFPVQRAAADLQHARGFLLVPLHGFQHAHDVRTLGFRERGQRIAGLVAGRAGRVQELYVRRPNRPAGRRQGRAGHGAFQLANV